MEDIVAAKVSFTVLFAIHGTELACLDESSKRPIAPDEQT